MRVEGSRSLDDSKLTQFAEIIMRDTPVRNADDPISQFLNDDKVQVFNTTTELISPPTTEELEKLTDKHNVEFALFYNIDRKKYMLTSGEPTERAADVDLGQFQDPETGQFDPNLFLVVHTHPDPFSEERQGVGTPPPTVRKPDEPFSYSLGDIRVIESIPQEGSLILTVKDGEESGFLFGFSDIAEGVYLGSDHPLNPTGGTYALSREPREGEGFQKPGFFKYGDEYLSVLRHELLKFGYSKELVDDIWANYE